MTAERNITAADAAAIADAIRPSHPEARLREARAGMTARIQAAARAKRERRESAVRERLFGRRAGDA